MSGDFRSPQYLALQNKYDAVCEALQTSGAIAMVARKLEARNLIGENVDVNAAGAGHDPFVVVSQLMQPVSNKVRSSWESFYDLVDVLNECEEDLSTPIGQTLEEECGTYMR